MAHEVQLPFWTAISTYFAYGEQRWTRRCRTMLCGFAAHCVVRGHAQSGSPSWPYAV